MVDQQVRHHPRQPTPDIIPSVELIPLAVQTQKGLLSKVPSELGVTRNRSPEANEATDVRLEALIETDLGHHHI